MGSKNAIAEWVVECLPGSEHFYDLFCGGCAITHAAMHSHKYKTFHVNDVTPMGTIFKSLVDGTRKVYYKWVSREGFLQTDDYLIKSIWSFGSDCSTYLYGKDIEPIKKSLHYAIVEGDYTLSDEIGIDMRFLDGVEGVYERYLDFRRKYGKSAPPNSDCSIWNASPELAPATPHINLQVEHIARLERIKSISNPPPPHTHLEATQLDYQEVEIKPKSTVFCDIPYISTHKYGCTFDHDRFYSWADSREHPVFITEYMMPPEFIPIAIRGRRGLMAANGKDGVKAEKIFVQRRFANNFKRDLFAEYINI